MAASTSPHFVSNAPAVARWDAADAQYLGHQLSCPVVMEMRFAEMQRLAFFKLRVPVGVKAVARKVKLYLFIYPEHVRSVDICPDPAPELVRNAFVTSKQSFEDIVGLRFCLDQPGSVVCPNQTPIVPGSAAYRNALHSLKSLAQATEFTIYVSSQDADKGHLEAMCKAAADAGLKSLAKESSLEMAYAGTGGCVMKAFDDDDVPESPPSYDEISLDPPPRSRDSSMKPPPLKRRRTAPIEDVQEQLSALVKTVADMRRELGLPPASKPLTAEDPGGSSDNGSFASRLSQVERQIATLQDRMSSLEETVHKTVEKRLQDAVPQVSSDVEDRVYGRLEDQLEERIDDRLYQERESILLEAGDDVDLKLEDSMTSIKEELMDFVQEQMREQMKDVEQELKDSLRTAVLSIDFD